METDTTTPDEDDIKYTDHIARLRARRLDLKDQLAALDHEIGEGDQFRGLLRKLPLEFWYPIHWAHRTLNSLPAIRNAGNPELSDWSTNSNVLTFCLNILIFLGVVGGIVTALNIIF